MRRRDRARCPWAKTELYVQYHDAEWGVPVHDDRLLFVLARPAHSKGGAA